MAIFRRWLLIVSALVLGGGPLLAAGTREDRAYAAATAAFHDEIWDRAATLLAQFAGNYPHSAHLPEAILLEAQADFKLGRFADAIALLAANQPAAGALADQYARWIGEAQFAKGDFAGAAATFVALTRDFPQSPLVLRATVEAAAACARLGDWRQHDALLDVSAGGFQQAVQQEPTNSLVLDGQLSRENSKFHQRDYAGVAAVYDWLNRQRPALTPEQAWRAAQIFYQAEMAAGDFEPALAAATNLVQIAGQPGQPEWPAQAAAAMGAALEKLNRLPEATRAWRENLTNTPAACQREAVLKIAALAAKQNDFTNAAADLEQFIGRFPDSPTVPLARLTLGELHLKAYAAQPAATNLLAAAQTNFDQFLGAFTNSPLAGKAYLDRGWCEWFAGRTNDCLADFQQAAQRLPFSEDLAAARFKVGDALYLLGEFAGARTNYESVLKDFSALPAVTQALGDRALYQILRTDLKLNDLPGAETAARRLLDKFPESELADDSQLLLGEAFSDFGSPNQARAVFREFAEKFPASPLKPEAELAAAQTFEREGNWPAAITNYDHWLQAFSTNAPRLLPRVEYLRGRAYFEAGDEAAAFAAATNFVARFPTNDLAPRAQWWIAGHYFRTAGAGGLEDFGRAETSYEDIFQNTNAVWQASPLVFPAQFMAGRAAMARQGFSDADRYFASLISDTNCLDEQLKAQARFAYAASLMQTPSADTNNPFANLQTATNMLSQMAPTNETGLRALGVIGDCDLQMRDFDGATNAYTQVADSPLAGADLRSRAEVGLGLALEKKADLAAGDAQPALWRQARDCYLDVLDRFRGNGDGGFWAKKAGLQALALIEKTGTPDPGRFIDDLETLFPQLKSQLEKKRVALAATKN